MSHSGADAPRVLVVDDDDDLRSIVGLTLGMKGFDVTLASGGTEALKMLCGGARPCLILLDLMMPGMNGWQFRAAQAQDPELAGIPVVLLSGDAGVSDAAAELGVPAFLRKPVTLPDLLATVRAFCGNGVPGEAQP